MSDQLQELHDRKTATDAELRKLVFFLASDEARAMSNADLLPHQQRELQLREHSMALDALIVASGRVGSAVDQVLRTLPPAPLDVPKA